MKRNVVRPLLQDKKFTSRGANIKKYMGRKERDRQKEKKKYRQTQKVNELQKFGKLQKNKGFKLGWH